MILFMTTEKNQSLFNFIQDDKGTPVREWVGEDYNLESFINNDFRKFNTCRFLAVDLDSINDIEIGLVTAKEAFDKWFDCRLLVVVNELTQELKEFLIDNDIPNIIDGTLDQMRKKIITATSPEGFVLEDHLEEIEDPPSQPIIEKIQNSESPILSKPLVLTVSGCQQRIGTTTFSLGLAHYIADRGKSVCYVEANKNNHLLQIIESYKMKKINCNQWHYKGIDFFTGDGEIGNDYEYMIFDLGIIEDDEFFAYKQADFNLIIGGSKGFEVNYLYHHIQTCQKKAIDNYQVYINFNPLKENVTDPNILNNAVFLNNSRYFMDYQDNEKHYRMLLGF